MNCTLDNELKYFFKAIVSFLVVLQFWERIPLLKYKNVMNFIALSIIWTILPLILK